MLEVGRDLQLSSSKTCQRVVCRWLSEKIQLKETDPAVPSFSKTGIIGETGGSSVVCVEPVAWEEYSDWEPSINSPESNRRSYSLERTYCGKQLQAVTNDQLSAINGFGRGT